MNIYDALKTDHKKVKELLTDLVVEDQDIEVYKKLVSQIRDELIPHSRAEEAVFYNTIRELEVGQDVVGHSYQEHLAAEGLLRTLQGLEVFDAKGLAIAKKLKEALEHHIEEEEGRVFSVAKKVLLDQEAEEIGAAFEKMKPQIKEKTVIGTTWDLVVNLMPLRLRKTFENSKTSFQKI